jgi:Fe2+ or Zn2+ uptake regulation protein
MKPPAAAQPPDPADRLRRAGLRVTGPRVAILAELALNRTHPGAEDIHRRLAARHPSLSVSTVYLTLEAFARAGLIHRLPSRDGRLRVDGTVADHDHATCRTCGTVFDILRDGPRPPLPARLPPGLSVLEARIEYDVLCRDCQKAAARPGRSAAAGRRTLR